MLAVAGQGTPPEGGDRVATGREALGGHLTGPAGTADYDAMWAHGRL